MNQKPDGFPYYHVCSEVALTAEPAALHFPQKTMDFILDKINRFSFF